MAVASVSVGYGDGCSYGDNTLTYTRYNALDNYCRELHKRKKTKVFIAKPPNGAMGVG